MQTGFREVFEAINVIFMESSGLTAEYSIEIPDRVMTRHSDALRAGR